MPLFSKTTATATIALTAFAFSAPAHADSTLLFPYVTTATSAYTFLTVFENPHTTDGTFDNSKKTLQMFASMKPLDRPNDELCAGGGYTYYEFGKPGTIKQWEMGGRFNLGADFGDEPPHIAPMSRYYDEHGYLMARYYSSDNQHPPADSSAQLYGEAVIVDTATGLIFAYSALQVPSARQPIDFTQFGGTEFASSWFLGAIAGTTWYVLPVGLTDFSHPHATEIRVVTNPQLPGAFTRNGEYFTGRLSTHKISCFGLFTLTDLLSPLSVIGWSRPRDDLIDLPMGGWFTLETSSPAMIWKTQQSGELGIPAATMNPVTIVR